ncbi:hypothetical protein [Caballeronia telluris]|uniref:hypothetical protein n=1 Tax=Caballeronia telluris TaxID=326475 RepID=UPI00135AA17A|nr:hypothetical protein [Caballeronia telluris]
MNHFSNSLQMEGAIRRVTKARGLSGGGTKAEKPALRTLTDKNEAQQATIPKTSDVQD